MPKSLERVGEKKKLKIMIDENGALSLNLNPSGSSGVNGVTDVKSSGFNIGGAGIIMGTPHRGTPGGYYYNPTGGSKGINGTTRMNFDKWDNSNPNNWVYCGSVSTPDGIYPS